MPNSCPNEPPSRRQLSAWLQEKLFERRIVLITGQLDDAVAAEVSAQLVTLAATREEPIDIYVDSPDGTIAAAFVLIDALDVLRAPVRAHCRGQIGGPVIAVVAAARQRSSSPHTRFRLGQPKAQFCLAPPIAHPGLRLIERQAHLGEPSTTLREATAG